MMDKKNAVSTLVFNMYVILKKQNFRLMNSINVSKRQILKK